MDGNRHSGSYIDDDLDFDLLLEDDDMDAADGPAHRGATDSTPRVGGSGGGGTGGTRLRVTPDWGRIATVGGVAVVVLFVVAFAVNAVLDHRKASSFRDYFAATGEVFEQSDAQGEELTGLLAQPSGADRGQLVARLERMQGRSERLVKDVQAIDAPEQLGRTHEWAITVLTYRANCVDALRRAMTSALSAKDRTAAATGVADANRRCDASDVVHQDSFVGSARTVLSREKITDVRVPESDFVQDSEFTSPKAIGLMLERLSTASKTTPTGEVEVPNDGKTRGGELQSVMMVPSGQQLSATALTEVAGSDDLAFEVTFLNQGEVQATQVPVTVELRGDNTEPIELTGVIEQVNPGESGSVRIDMGEVPTFGDVLTVSVTAGPVPGEKNASNNSATFQVLFKL